MSTTGRFSSVFDLPRQDIRLDPARFQGRQGEYSEETVNAIVSSGRFDPTVSALVVWKDPDSGKYFLLSGHSRYEAAKRLYESGKQPELTSLPVKELMNATEEEAVEYATIESNRRGTEEGLISDLKAYRLAVNSGKNATQLKRLFRPDTKLRRLQELSYLNPRGMFIEQLAAPSQQSFPYLERNARWVGDMRRQLPTLTDAHERELFDYLYGSKKGLNLDKAKFYDLVNNKVNRLDFDPELALNLHDRISPTAYTDPLNEQMRELDKEIDTAQKEIDNRRATMARANAEGVPVPKYQGRITFEERIAELNRHIIRLIERKEAIRQSAGKVERTMGGDLFSQVEEPKATEEQLKPATSNAAPTGRTLREIQDDAKLKLGITAWNQFVEEGTIRPDDADSIRAALQMFDEGKRPGGRLRPDLQMIEDLGPADPQEGFYYVTAADGGHGVYMMLGPFAKHADAISNAYNVQKVSEKEWKKYHPWIRFGTARMVDKLPYPVISAEGWEQRFPDAIQPMPEWRINVLNENHASRALKEAGYSHLGMSGDFVHFLKDGERHKYKSAAQAANDLLKPKHQWPVRERNKVAPNEDRIKAMQQAAPAVQKAIETEQAFKVGDRVIYVDENRKFPQYPAGAGQNVGIINSIVRSTTAPHEPIGYDIQPDAKGYRSVYKTAKDVLSVISSREERDKRENEKKAKEEKSKLKFWEKSDVAMSIIKLAKDNGFQFSDWDKQERTLWFETRENGDVASETQGSADLAARKKVMQILRNEYEGVSVRADDSGTEWVAFEVTLPTQEEQDKAKATPALAKRDTPELPKARVMLVTRQYGEPIYITHLPDDKQFGFTGTDKEDEAVTWESTGDNQDALAEILRRAKFVTGWDGLRFEAAYQQPVVESPRANTNNLLLLAKARARRVRVLALANN
jgi:hypothetical protein